MSIIIHYATRFRGGTNSILCRLFQAAAYDTWERIAFSRTRPRMKIHETSITQNLIYEMNLMKWKLRISGFSIYESTNEAAHGDDIEICIKQASGLIYKYAIQAKILYHSMRKGRMIRLDNGVYKQFKHSVNNQPQVGLLLDYARYEGAIPLYLLYNYVARTFINGEACNIDFDIPQYGCSLVTANYLKSNYSDASSNLKPNVKFTQLHPAHAMPWFMLACCLPNYTLEQTVRILGAGLDYTPRAFTTQEIEEERFRWNLLGELSETRTNDIGDFKEVPTSFFPKYRIMIG